MKLDFSIQWLNVWSIFVVVVVKFYISNFTFDTMACFTVLTRLLNLNECTAEHSNINLFPRDGSSFILSFVVLLYYFPSVKRKKKKNQKTKYPEPVLFRGIFTDN